MGIIATLLEKGNAFFGRVPRDVRVVALLIAAMLASFAFGYVAGYGQGKEEGIAYRSAPQAVPMGDESVVASRSGTKYYLPWCAGAARITDANKVWFATPAAAAASGYEPAANCDGL